MENKLVTLAVHTNDKAQILKNVLLYENIDVYLESVYDDDAKQDVSGIRVRIKESDLSRALTIVESHRLFSYDDEQTYLVDDGNLRILVPIDFSDYSLNACRIAFNIAQSFDAKVKIYHVYYNPYYPVTSPIAGIFEELDPDGKQVKTIIDKVRDNMQKLCAEIEKKIREGEFPAVNYSYSLREGIAEEEIASYAKSYKPALIVMGSKGGSNSSKNVLGSVTAQVIEMVNIPLLAIPKESLLKDPTNMKHIAFCTRFSQRDLVSFETVAKFTRLHIKNGKITLIHINEADKSKTEKWSEDKIVKVKNYFAERYPDIRIEHKLIEGNDLFSSISQYAIDEKIEIMALNTRKRNIFVRMFVPSISRKLLAQSNVALFVLRG